LSSDVFFSDLAGVPLGCLERWRMADFIFLDLDIFTFNPREVLDTRVLEAWVCGRKVWEPARGSSQR